MPATATAAQRRKKSSSARRDDEAPIIPILARKVREAGEEALDSRQVTTRTEKMRWLIRAFYQARGRKRLFRDEPRSDVLWSRHDR